MNKRILFLVLVGLAGFAVGAPFAAAQESPRVVFEVEFAHPSMELSETGRADMGVTVKGYMAGSSCAQSPTYTVPLKLDSFAKWAGSSMEPFSVTFTGPPAPGPGPTARQDMAPQETTLNLAWNVDDAPKKGAKQDYYIIIAKSEVVQQGQQNCAPQPDIQGGKWGPMTVTLPDRLENVNGTGGPDCASDPFQAACQGLQTSEPAESPAFDAVLLVAAVLGLGHVLRRRQ